MVVASQAMSTLQKKHYCCLIPVFMLASCNSFLLELPDDWAQEKKLSRLLQVIPLQHKKYWKIKKYISTAGNSRNVKILFINSLNPQGFPRSLFHCDLLHVILVTVWIRHSWQMYFFNQQHGHTQKKKIQVSPTGVEPMTLLVQML